MESLKLMLRDHEHVKLGQKIKSIVYNINHQGEVKAKTKVQLKKKRSSVTFEQLNERATFINREESSCTMYAGDSQKWKSKKRINDIV